MKKEIIQQDEHNPRQVFIDWVTKVRAYAVSANDQLKDSRRSKLSRYKSRDAYIDDASDYIGKIIGACDAIMTVIKQ